MSREYHLKVANRILRYLKKIGDLVLFYLIGDSFKVVENEDGDYKWYQVDIKSISRITHFLGSSLIS